MSDETPQPSPGCQTDAIGSILVIVEGGKAISRPTRLKQIVDAGPRPGGMAPPRDSGEPKDP